MGKDIMTIFDVPVSCKDTTKQQNIEIAMDFSGFQNLDAHIQLKIFLIYKSGMGTGEEKKN